MYATVRRYEGVTNVSEAARLVQDIFLPVISEIPGFVAYYWIDAGGGVMISTSIFENKVGAEESNRRAAATVRESLAAVLPKQPQVMSGNVVAYK